LIVTEPGSLQNGLHALIASIPNVYIAGEASNAAMALQMVEEYRPDLVLLNADLPNEEAMTVLKRIKRKRAQIHCIALARDVWQQQQAENSGADIALLKGFPATKLAAIIESLLQRDRK
jgi:DNA-binding NarL/FixJ family response regulator